MAQNKKTQHSKTQQITGFDSGVFVFKRVPWPGESSWLDPSNNNNRQRSELRLHTEQKSSCVTSHHRSQDCLLGWTELSNFFFFVLACSPFPREQRTSPLIHDTFRRPMSIDSLLNFSAELDVALLDQAVAAFYTGRAAPDVRTGVLSHPSILLRLTL